MDSSLFYNLSVLPDLIKNTDVLFVTLPKEHLGVADNKMIVQTLINDNNFCHITYSGSALPVKDVQKLYNNIKGKDFSHIVAVGGGTVIDIAKIIAIALSNCLDKIDDILSNPYGFKNLKQLIFVPTTCGTGSEATHFAVVYKDGRKYSVANESIRAESVILDHTLLVNLPEKIRNATVLDALSQAIESFWSKNSTKQSSQYAKEAIVLILKGIDSIDITEKLKCFQIGSYLAGKAINISKTTAPHAISYPLTAKFGIPHGIAVFLTLSEIAEINCNSETENIFNELFELFKVNDIFSFNKSLSDIMNIFGFSLSLSSYGVKSAVLPEIAENSIVPGRSDNNPVEVNKEVVLNVLKKIL